MASTTFGAATAFAGVSLGYCVWRTLFSKPRPSATNATSESAPCSCSCQSGSSGDGAETSGGMPRALAVRIEMLGEIHGAWSTQALYTLCKLRVFDELLEKPRTVDALAADVGCHRDSLMRLLRACVSAGWFSVDRSTGVYSVTDKGAIMTDKPGGLRHVALLTGSPLKYQTWGHLLTAMRTGREQATAAMGSDFYTYLFEKGPKEEIEDFDNAMTAMSGDMSVAANMPLAKACHFHSSASLVCDIGGGRGTFLSTLLSVQPTLKGFLFDLKRNAEAFKPAVEGIDDRVTTYEGDFFKRLPVADAYTMKNVIHDWDDEHCDSLLSTVAAAMRREGENEFADFAGQRCAPKDRRLYILEVVLPDDDEFNFAKWCDISFLVTVGGRERTKAEYAELLQRNGLQLVGVTPSGGPQSRSIVEAALLL